MLRLFAKVACLLICSLSVRAEDVVLKVGDAAPALSPAKWLKGQPVSSFEKGKLYVVEFWATWCGPCKQSIPHLTDLQKKYPDVTFIGQSVWEQDQTAVEPFVKEMGEKMNYRVALDDGEQGRMANNWMQAAAQDGIPTAFIIDKESRIAWIGHPMEMDDVLDQVTKGTFDAQAAAEKVSKLETLQDKLTTAMQNSDFDTALATMDELEKFDPSRAPDIDTVRFQVLLQKHDLEAAFKVADRLGSSQKDPEILNLIAWRMVDPVNPIENPDLAIAEKCALRAVETSGGRRGDIIDTLARVYFLQGKLDKAIETQTKAVDQADQPELKRDLQKTLDEYKLRK